MRTRRHWLSDLASLVGAHVNLAIVAVQLTTSPSVKFSEIGQLESHSFRHPSCSEHLISCIQSCIQCCRSHATTYKWPRLVIVPQNKHIHMFSYCVLHVTVYYYRRRSAVWGEDGGCVLGSLIIWNSDYRATFQYYRCTIIFLTLPANRFLFGPYNIIMLIFPGWTQGFGVKNMD